MQGWQESWSRGVDEASRLAGRALAAGPDNSTCLASAAFTYGVLSYRFEEAFELANRALMVHPNSLFVRNRAAAVYGVCGESDKAIAQCEAACRMNPLDSKKAATATFSILSFALYMARRFEESISLAGARWHSLRRPNTARKYVAASLGQLGHTDEARAEIAELIKHQPDASLALFRQHGFRHKWMHELHLEGLRKAGLREDSEAKLWSGTLFGGAARHLMPHSRFVSVGSRTVPRVRPTQRQLIPRFRTKSLQRESRQFRARNGLGAAPSREAVSRLAAVARTEGRPHGAGVPWQERRHGTPGGTAAAVHVETDAGGRRFQRWA